MNMPELKLARDRDILLEACKFAFGEIDDCYDVDQEGENFTESPFNGAGEVLVKLRLAIDKAEGAA